MMRLARERSGPERGAAAAALLLAGAALAVHGRALPHPFHIDDHFIIRGDPRVARFDLPALVSQQYWPAGDGNAVWRPLTLVTLAANAAVAPEPWAFRLINLALHAAVALGVYLIARELAAAFTPALVAALLFLVHPIHTTPVNQLVDRADFLAAAGVVMASWLWLRRAAQGAPRPIAAAALFAAALLSKESAVAFVAVIGLIEAAQRGAGLRRSAPALLCVALMLAGWLIARTVVLGALARPAHDVNPLDNVIAHPDYGLDAGASPILARWGTPLAVAARAAALLAWPAHLSWDYSYAAIAPVRSWLDARMWAGAALLTAAGLATAASLRRGGRAWLPIGGALACYAVVSNVFVIIGSAFAERYLYLPAAMLAPLAAIGLSRAAPAVAARSRPAGRRTWANALLQAGAAAAVAALAVRTIVRHGDFVSGATLNAADLASQPNSARLWGAAAADALNAGEFETALERARRALAIFPRHASAERIAGLACWRLGRADEGLAHLLQSLRLEGRFHESACLAAADILTTRGEYTTALDLLEGCLRENPRSAGALNNLAWALLTAEPAALRDPVRAVELARRAADLEPCAGDVLDTLVAALLAAGDVEGARRTLRDALPRLAPDDGHLPALRARQAGLEPR